MDDFDLFLDNIKKAFPDSNVNKNNVFDFYIVLNDKNNCKDCKGLDYCQNSNNGYRLEYKKNNFVQEPCKYLNQYKKNEYKFLIKSIYDISLFDSSLDNYDKDTIDRNKILNEIDIFINEFGKKYNKGLYIYGESSIGKTYTLSLLAKELEKKNIKNIFVYFPDLVTELKECLGTGKYYNIIDLLKNVDVLLLDDFGAENVTPWLRDEVIGPLINYRLLYKKPLFISSNISPDNIARHLAMNNTNEEVTNSERIVKRLYDLLKTIKMTRNKDYKRI